MLMAGTELRVKGGNEWVINSVRQCKRLHVHIILLGTFSEASLYWKHMFSNLGIHSDFNS